MNIPTTCTLRFLYYGADGFDHYTSDCGRRARLEWSPSAGGPWYEDRVVEAGQDIPIDPNAHTRPCYYRLVYLPDPEPAPIEDPQPEPENV